MNRARWKRFRPLPGIRKRVQVMKSHGDLLIIGAGLAGLMAGWQAAAQGMKVRVVAKGWGATHWLSGCVDVLGYYPLDNARPVTNPAGTLPHLIAAQPQHPYALVGPQKLAAALAALQTLCAEADYPLHGSLDHNWLLPSAVGTFRPTCLAPETMIAGDLSHPASMLIVGFRQLRDFYPNLVADNLSQQGIPAGYVTLDLPSLQKRGFNTPVTLARMFEDTLFRSEVVAKLQPLVRDVERVGFPAVLGLHDARTVKEALEARLRRPVFEIPSLTPSIAGIRLHNILLAAIKQHGGQVFDGMEALAADSDAGHITAVYTEASARRRAHRYDHYLLATGGILGGGLRTDYQGQIREVVFDLPVSAPAGRLNWFRRDFMDREGHPIYQSGLQVDAQFRPVAANGTHQAVYQNLYAAGTTLAHCEVIRERSFEGVALATGYAAIEALRSA